MDLSQHFAPIVIACPGYEERLSQFDARAKELGLSGIDIVWGVDGRKIETPDWWRSTGTKFACNMAHLYALYRGLSYNKPLLIFEDDVWLLDDFVERINEVIEYMARPDATVLYLGGAVKRHGRERLGTVVRPARVIGAYAYAVTQDYAKTMTGYMMNTTPPGGKVKWQFNDVRMANRGLKHGYAFSDPPMAGHRGGFSVIHGTMKKQVYAPASEASLPPS